MTNKRHTIIFLLLLFAKSSLSQVVKPYFNLVKGTNNFTLGKVASMAQDKFGYMWFAEQQNGCLVRYDGYNMKIYRNDPADTNTVNSKNFECIAADASGNIWTGVQGGVDKFDFATNKFIHYHYPVAEKYDIGNCLLIDRAGIAWIGTNTGIVRLDPVTGKSVRYVHKENDPSSLGCNMVRSLYEDKAGVLWVGTGLEFEPKTKEGGLSRIDKKTGTFISYTHDPLDPNSLAGNKVRSIFEDSKGNFWIGTDNNGLHLMDRKNGTFQRFVYDPLHPEKLSIPPVTSGEQFKHITFITEDVTGKIWIGTYSDGIVCYNPITKKIEHFTNVDKNRQGGYNDNSSWATYVSRDRELWISNEIGELFRVDPYQSEFSEEKIEESVTSFLEDSAGNLMINTESKGLRIENKKTGEKTLFSHNPADSFSISSNTGTFLQQRSDGQFWVGTWNGLNLFTPQTGKFNRYFYNPGLSAQDMAGGVFNILETKSETYYGLFGKLCIKNNITGILTFYVNNPSDTNSIAQGGPVSFLDKGDGNIWMCVWATEGGGLDLFNIATKKFRHYLKGLIVWEIFKGSDGRMWVGTSRGLYSRSDLLDSFIPAGDDGTQFREARVKSITEDDDKNIWGVSSLGIFRFSPQKKELCIYGDKYGTLDVGAPAYKPSFRTSDGELLFGNPHGYYKCRSKDVINLSPPQVMITDIKADGHSLKQDADGLFKGAIEDVKQITLSYDQNKISIDFAAIHFAAPENNISQFMLKGYETEWRSVKEEKTAYYFNLPPGQYVFMIKASSSYGIKAASSIKITVLPPWWQTWWFRISLLVLIGAIFYLSIKWWLNRKFQLQLAHSEKERQLSELKNKTTQMEMQALRAQMNPHFIFNSLNSINRFILQNNKVRASEYLTKFSKLVRMILQNSQATLITLESELEALQLYMELEALRFDNHFTYAVAVSKELDADILKVPPLIIQPFVENSIWHGLMHKETKGSLDIEISQQQQNLFIKIKDDGIGRKEAGALASKSATRHKSMGLKITADRIAMIQLNGDSSSPVVIHDLTNPDGSSAGTEVIIKMRLIYD